jgi:hypothetical protein
VLGSRGAGVRPGIRGGSGIRTACRGSEPKAPPSVPELHRPVSVGATT